MAEPQACSCAKAASAELTRKLLQLATVLGLIVAAFGALQLVGWTFNIPELLTPTISQVNTKAGTSLGLMLSGLSVALLSKYPCGCHLRVNAIIKAMSFVVFCFGAITLLEYFSGIKLGIDDIIVRDTTGLGTVPGRMGPNTALCIAAFALSCSFVGSANLTIRKVAGAMNALVFAVSLLGLIGYFYGVKDFYTISAFTQMAFGTALSLLALASGRALCGVDEEPFGIISSTTSGGYLARRLLPVSILLPVAVGGFVFDLVAVRLHADNLAHAILIVSMAAFLSILSYFISTAVHGHELSKRAAKEEVDQLNRQLQEKVDRLALLNSSLETAMRRAEEATILKSNFIANISHELRTPIAGIIGSNELMLKDHSLTRESTDLVRTSQSCASALLILVNDLLDLSKIEFGQLVLRHVSFDPSQLLKATLNFYSGETTSRLSLVAEVSPDVPKVVTGDPARIRQLLLNLISNAIKFTASGQICARVEVESRTDDRVSLKFSVTDTGLGISAADQKLLFKPFSQVDSSPTRQFGGAGLGLSINKGLIDTMGGTMGMESEPGKGSCFWFTIPLAMPTEVSLPATQQPPAIMPFKAQPILLVEDNAVIQKLVSKQLATLGLKVVAAGNGREALELVANRSFSLILMDCNLPDMTGYDITRQIRHDESGTGKRVPIVAMTAAALPEDRERCLAAGMDDYLSKPVSIEKLRQTVAKWALRNNQVPDGLPLVQIQAIPPDKHWMLPANY